MKQSAITPSRRTGEAALAVLRLPRDVVAANELALAQDASDVFNIGTSIETDVNALFNHLRTLTRSSCREDHGPAKKGEQQRSVLDWGKANRLLGWEPRTTLDVGLAETVSYFTGAARR